jgi:hypothetical protein
MTPRFERTRRFANPYVMLAVDGLYIIIWLSAFSTQAAYNSSGQCGGSCGISKAVVAAGVFATYVFLPRYEDKAPRICLNIMDSLMCPPQSPLDRNRFSQCLHLAVLQLPRQSPWLRQPQDWR